MNTDSEISRLFSEYLEICEFVLRRRPATIKSYKDAFSHLLNLVPSVNEPHHLTTNNLIRFFKLLQTRKRVVGRDTIITGVKDSTIATYWSKLNSFFVWLETHKHIDKNPLSNINKPKAIYENKPALKKSDLEKLYSSIILKSKSPFLQRRDTVIVSTLFFTGVRKSELLQLQLRDIDLEGNIITIRGVTSKSKRTRKIPLHPTLKSHLKDYLRERQNYRCSYLIVSANADVSLTQNGIKQWVKRMKKNSGVSFHLHQLRHTFACNLAKNNISIAKLQSLMGHTDLRMTERYLRSLGVEHSVEDILKLSIDDSY